MSPKNIIILLGSPRKKGNSALLAQEAAKGAQEAGAAVESFYLHGLNIRFCLGCNKCRAKTALNCVQDDDMQSLYPKLRRADAVVFASPVYWAHVTAQMKVFMDRCYALGGPEGHDLEGKRYGVILTYANIDPFKSGAINAVRTFQDSFSTGIVDIICGQAKEAGEIKKNRELMERAYRLGKELCR
ncbi:MAG: flavodoxin family protein [Desulfobacteraceae bacterium]|nr:MAG: flavodoxin family protein [Desulfobacteraceae bacterium]